MTAQTEDSMRGLRRELTAAVKHARSAMKRRVRVAEFLGEYLELVRLADERREQGLALGCSGSLFEPMAPIPINQGFVGLSDAEKFRREWLLETPPSPAMQIAA